MELQFGILLLTVGPRSRASDGVRRREVRARASFFQIRALWHEATLQVEARTFWWKLEFTKY